MSNKRRQQQIETNEKAKSVKKERKEPLKSIKKEGKEQLKSVKKERDEPLKSVKKMKGIPRNVLKQFHHLREALKEQKEVRSKQESCQKHMSKLATYDPDYMMTINELYGDYSIREFNEDDNKNDLDMYSVVNKDLIYDDPIGDVMLELFEDGEHIQVKSLVGLIEDKMNELKKDDKRTMRQIAGLLDKDEINFYDYIDDNLDHSYESIDNLYDYMQESELITMKKIQDEKREIKEKQRDVKDILTRLAGFHENEIYSVENLYAIPNKREKVQRKLNSDVMDDSCYAKAAFSLPNGDQSICLKETIQNEFGDDDRVTVKRLVRFFEIQETGLQEKYDNVLVDMADILVEKTKISKDDTVMVENSLYGASPWTSEVNKEESRTGCKAYDEKLGSCLTKDETQLTKSKNDIHIDLKQMSRLEFITRMRNNPTDEMKLVMIERFGHAGKLSVRELIEMFNAFFENNFPSNSATGLNSLELVKDEDITMLENDLYSSSQGLPKKAKTKFLSVKNHVMCENEIYEGRPRAFTLDTNIYSVPK